MPGAGNEPPAERELILAEIRDIRAAIEKTEAQPPDGGSRTRRCAELAQSISDLEEELVSADIGGAIRSIRASAEDIEHDVRNLGLELTLSPLEESQRETLAELLKAFDPKLRKEQLQRASIHFDKFAETAQLSDSALLKQLEEEEELTDGDVGLNDTELSALLDEMSKSRCDTAKRLQETVLAPLLASVLEPQVSKQAPAVEEAEVEAVPAVHGFDGLAEASERPETSYSKGDFREQLSLAITKIHSRMKHRANEQVQ